jgi:putative transposase
MNNPNQKTFTMSAHAKTDLKVHLTWIPKYRKKVLTGEIAIRVREIIREVARAQKVQILSGKVAADHVHILIQ